MGRAGTILLLTGLLVVSGCAFSSGKIGDVFTPEVVQKIQDGKTMKQEVVGLLGEPTLQFQLANGRERYAYHFSTINGSLISFLGVSISASQRSEMLDIVFRDGVVESHQHFVPKAAPAGG